MGGGAGGGGGWWAGQMGSTDDTRRGGDGGGEGAILCNLGILSMTLGEFAAARDHLERALAVGLAVGARPRPAIARPPRGDPGVALFSLVRWSLRPGRLFCRRPPRPAFR